MRDRFISNPPNAGLPPFPPPSPLPLQVVLQTQRLNNSFFSFSSLSSLCSVVGKLRKPNCIFSIISRDRRSTSSLGTFLSSKLSQAKMSPAISSHRLLFHQSLSLYYFACSCLPPSLTTHATCFVFLLWAFVEFYYGSTLFLVQFCIHFLFLLSQPPQAPQYNSCIAYDSTFRVSFLILGGPVQAAVVT